MENVQEIIGSIHENEIKEKMKELYEAMEVLSHKQPVTGFHHRFYVPGWIGSIQWLIVSSKMDKWCKQPFYKGMDYYEFADWIGDTAHVLHDYLNNPATKGRVDYEQHSNEIVSAVYMLMYMWVECSPEVSSFTDRDYLDEATGQEYKVSIGFLLNKRLEDEVGKPSLATDTTAKSSVWKDIKEDAKSYGYMIAGWLINLVIFLLIVGLISAIFD